MMSNARRFQSLLLYVSLLLSFVPSWVVADEHQAMEAVRLQLPAVQAAPRIDHLYVAMTFICLMILIVVFGMMFYVILKHRKTSKDQSAPFHESIGAEMVWVVIPFLIALGMLLPAVKAIFVSKDIPTVDSGNKVTQTQWNVTLLTRCVVAKTKNIG